MAKRKRKKASLPAVNFYSFWKPDPLQQEEKKYGIIRLGPLGSIGEVSRRLFSIPNVQGTVTSPILIGRMPIITAIWRVGPGVMLRLRPEYLHKRNEVYTIGIISAVDGHTLYRLYVQMHEHLGVTIFDETRHEFYDLNAFKQLVHRGP